MVIMVIVVIVVIEVIMVIMDARVALVFMFVGTDRTDIYKYLFVKGSFRNSCDVFLMAYCTQMLDTMSSLFLEWFTTKMRP